MKLVKIIVTMLEGKIIADGQRQVLVNKDHDLHCEGDRKDRSTLYTYYDYSRIVKEEHLVHYQV